MNKSEMFMEEVIRICKETDFAKLHQSLNGGDGVYGNEVLEQLKESHRRLLGDYPLPEEEDELVPFPAKITKESGGMVWLGICVCRVIPLQEDSFLFGMLHGHLIQTAGLMIPAKYKEMGYDPCDLFFDGGAEVIVYSADREVAEKIEQGKREEEVLEENEEEAFQILQ